MTDSLPSPAVIGLKPMHVRPEPGQSLTLRMKDGSTLFGCHSTRVYKGDKVGIIIYHMGKSVDESLAKGWWPHE